MSRKSNRPSDGKHPVTFEEAAALAEDDLRAGYAPTTAAGNFVHLEREKEQLGQHSTVSSRQSVAIGLSNARRAGIPLGANPTLTRAAAARARAEIEAEKKGKPVKKREAPPGSAAYLAKRIAKPKSEQAERMTELASLPSDVRMHESSRIPRIYSEEATTTEEVPMHGVRAVMSKPKLAKKRNPAGFEAPPASKLGGRLSGARIRAAAHGLDPEAAAQEARAEVDAIEVASMKRKASLLHEAGADGDDEEPTKKKRKTAVKRE